MGRGQWNKPKNRCKICSKGATHQHQFTEEKRCETHVMQLPHSERTVYVEIKGE